MAAQNGHLELRRFLLQEASFPADNAVLNSALEEVQFHSGCGFPGTNESLLEAFYSLFVGEHNLDIDLPDPPTPITGIFGMTHTKTSLGVVLASQPIPFGNLSLAQKFSAAIEAVGWPADVFTTMLHSHDPTEVGTRTTENGKTALHWAVAHLGEWLRLTQSNCESLYISRRVASYAKLASNLIRMGADVHALWREQSPWFKRRGRSRRYDPFTVFLKGVGLATGDCWDRPGMARAVKLWGEVLVEGGVHLDNYIATEDEFLGTTDWLDLDIPSSGVPGGCLALVRLSISEELTLAVEIREILCVTVFKAQATHMPGAWPTSPLFVDTIIWSPVELDECYGFYWDARESVALHTKLERTQIHVLSIPSGPDELMYDSIADAERGRQAGRVSQDDHGLVARVLGLGTKSCHSGHRASTGSQGQTRGRVEHSGPHAFGLEIHTPQVPT
jgi:hypothetical protein